MVWLDSFSKEEKGSFLPYLIVGITSSLLLKGISLLITSVFAISWALSLINSFFFGRGLKFVKSKSSLLFLEHPETINIIKTKSVVVPNPIIINSSYRSPSHAVEIVKSKPGEHTYGAAVDIKCTGGTNTFNLVSAAIKVGFKGIGISRKSNFVHLGIGYPGAPSPTIWTY